MRQKLITLFEYDSQEFELGVGGLRPREINLIAKLNNSIKKREKGGDIIVCEYVHHGRIRLKTFSYVGILRAGRVAIQILPKIARRNLAGREFNDEIVRNLLYMLSYTKRLPIKESDIASLKRTNGSFFEVLIFLFAQNLWRLIQNDINKEYVRVKDNFTFIKGKLCFPSHLKRNLILRHRFYLEFDEFCEDNLLNQVFKYTVYLLLKVSADFNNIKILQKLKFLFSEVSWRPITLNDFKKINLTRLNKRYEPVLNLSKIFIGLESVELNFGQVNIFSLLFDMNVLFEEFIGEFIKKNFFEFNFISLQGPTKNFVVSKEVGGREEGGGLFKLRPDIQIGESRDNIRLIIDTKYKILKESDSKEGVLQSDLYQMYAYSKKYNCPDIVLLYPGFHFGSKNVKFKIDDESCVHIRTINLSRDLKRDKEKFKNELGEILLTYYKKQSKTGNR